MSVRDSFVKHFGQHNAICVENCAHEHRNGINNQNTGSDPFKHALLLVIGYQCIEKYAVYHKFDMSKISRFRFERWCVEHAHLDTHDGDCDYISLIAGIYNKFMPKKGES
jgi:hypothetical protein